MKHDAIRARLKLDNYDDETIDKFFKWHDKRIRLWKAYERKAFELLKAGHTRIGSKSIFEKLREDPGMHRIGEFKVDNTYTGMWARCLTYKHPVFKKHIIFKTINGEGKKAA